MGQNRMYIRNLALSLMGELKVDQKIFSQWGAFPLVVQPARALFIHSGDKLERKLMGMTPETLGRIAVFGRKDQSPHFPNMGTTLREVLGEYGLDTGDYGVRLVLRVAQATIMAEMTDILLERLTPEQRARFEVKFVETPHESGIVSDT